MSRLTKSAHQLSDTSLTKDYTVVCSSTQQAETALHGPNTSLQSTVASRPCPTHILVYTSVYTRLRPNTRVPCPSQSKDLIMFITFRFILITIFMITPSLQQSSKMLDEDDAIMIMNDCVNKALAPVIASISERQDATEARTYKQLDNLQSLLDTISSAISYRSNTGPVSHRLTSWSSCHLCGETLENLENLDLHIQHNHPSLVCLECGKTARSVPDLNYHNHKYHQGGNDNPDGPIVQKCHLCDYAAGCTEDMKTHMAKYHDASSYYSCAICSNTSSTLMNFKEHLKLEHDVVNPANCSTCDLIFLNETELQSHTVSAHNGSTPTISSNRAEPLPATSETLPVFTCTICASIYYNMDDLNSHITTNHTPHTLPVDAYYQYPAQNLLHPYPYPDRPYSNYHIQISSLRHCNDCNLTFTDMRELNIHLQVHRQVKASRKDMGQVSPQTCSQCEKSFDNIACQEVHVCHPLTHQCDFFSSTSSSAAFVNSKNYTPLYHNPQEIPQLDGNISLTDLSISTCSTSALNPSSNRPEDTAILSVAEPAPGNDSDNIQLQYKLNPANQVRRLMDNTNRPGVEIQYKNMQMIIGRKTPHQCLFRL